MKGIGIRFESDGDDEEDEKCLDAVVAISPDEDVYFDYESIPQIPSPSFLMVKDGTIIIDRWIIAVKRWQPFLDFVGNLCSQWNDNSDEGRRQLSGFVMAVEQELLRCE